MIHKLSTSFNERGKEFLLLKSLTMFYRDRENFETLLFFLKNKKRRLSLRLLDWLVTNYSKKHNVVLREDTENVEFMYLAYKNHLKSYSKKFFDAFARRQRLFYTFDHRVHKISHSDIETYGERQDGIVTTVAQMNAFRFFITSGVVDYALKNLDSIEQDMISCHDRNGNKKKKQRQNSRIDDPPSVENNFENPIQNEISKNNNVASNIVKLTHKKAVETTTNTNTGFNTFVIYRFKMTVQFNQK